MLKHLKSCVLETFGGRVDPNFGGVVPPNNHWDIESSLCANGCEELAPGFIAEEVEVRQKNQMSDQDLLSLGVRTIGARLCLCSVAASKEPPQIYLFTFLTFL